MVYLRFREEAERVLRDCQGPDSPLSAEYYIHYDVSIYIRRSFPYRCGQNEVATNARHCSSLPSEARARALVEASRAWLGLGAGCTHAGGESDENGGAPAREQRDRRAQSVIVSFPAPGSTRARTLTMYSAGAQRHAPGLAPPVDDPEARHAVRLFLGPFPGTL